jgi:RND superfamily putative drug exporter
VLGSLTVLPALLSRLGDKVDRVRVPLVGRSAATTAKGGSGARSSTASCAGRRCRRRSRRVAAGCSPRRRCSCASRLRAESFPQSLEVDQDVRPDAAGVPGLGAARERRRQGAERATPGDAEAIAELERRALASGRAFEPITVDVNRRARSRTSPSRSQATEPTRVERAFRVLRETIVPRRSAPSEHEAGVTGRPPQWRDQATS